MSSTIITVSFRKGHEEDLFRKAEEKYSECHSDKELILKLLENDVGDDVE